MKSTAPKAPVTVHYFASVRERLGVSQENLEIPEVVVTVNDFISWLRSRGEKYELALHDDLRIRVAIDRVHASPDTHLGNAREVALFPMMTGG